MPAEDKKQISIRVAEAIAYLHKMGISHRDIKTENVIVGSYGDVRVIDFGFATTLSKG